jgi:hypothetical protein
MILLHPLKGSEAVMDSDGFAQGMCQMYRCSVVNIALTACVQLHETFDCRRESLHTKYESLVTDMKNFPGQKITIRGG